MMNSKPKPTRSFNELWSGVNLSDNLIGKAGRWVMLKFVHLAAQSEAKFNCLCVIQDIGNFLVVVIVLLCNLVVEIPLLVTFPVMFTEDEFFPSRWITNAHPPKLCVVSTASSMREKAIWQTHLS